MINKDEQPDPLEITSEQAAVHEPVDEHVIEATEDLPDQPEVQPTVDDAPASDEETPPPVQTDIEHSAIVEEPQVLETDNESQTEEETPPPVQTDIEQISTEKPDEEELLLPAKATPDEPTATAAVVIHSPENSKSIRLRTWLIALLFVIIIAIIGLVLYIFVFKANATITPGTQIFGS